MTPSTANVILLINFLHCVAAGVVLPVLPRAIVALVGHHLFTGFLHSLVYLSQLVTRDLLELLPRGKLYALKFCLFCCFTYYFILVFYRDWVTAFIVRCLYALTTDVLFISKGFIEKTEPEDTHIKIFNLIDISRTVGLALGSVIGGYIFQYNGHFSPVGAGVACMLILICNFLLGFLQSEDIFEDPDSHLIEIPAICYRKISQLKKIFYSDEWRKFLFQECFIFSFSLYLAYWVHLLGYNYRVNAIYIGYAIAYEHLIVFLSNCLVPFIREQTNDEVLFKLSMFVSGVALIAVIYAPTYYTALLIYALVILMYTIKNAIFDADVLNLAKDNLYEASTTCNVLISMTVPIFVRVIGHFLGDGIVKLLIVASVCLYIFLGSKITLKVQDN